MVLMPLKANFQSKRFNFSHGLSALVILYLDYSITNIKHHKPVSQKNSIKVDGFNRNRDKVGPQKKFRFLAALIKVKFVAKFYFPRKGFLLKNNYHRRIEH